MKPFRKKIWDLHREVDGFLGEIFTQQKQLKYVADSRQHNFKITDKNQFLYSKKEHFSFFHLLETHKNQNPATCDLKVYQDLFVYSYIIDNLPRGSKILEIGGGESRVIEVLKNDYKFWNLDKLEGEGFGPKNIASSEGFIHIKDSIGNFSRNLPDNYFDLIFSISVIEHFPQSYEALSAIYNDMNRVLKKGAFSIHCIDSLRFSQRIWFHPFIFLLEEKLPEIDLTGYSNIILADEDLWVLSNYAYYTRWFSKTHKSIKNFGSPFSTNLIWQKK